MENSFLQAVVLAAASCCYLAAMVIIFRLSAYFKVRQAIVREITLAYVAVVFLAVICYSLFKYTLAVEQKFAVIFLVVGIFGGVLIGYLEYRDKLKKFQQNRQQRRHTK